jgi:hypothetical protein
VSILFLALNPASSTPNSLDIKINIFTLATCVYFGSRQDFRLNSFLDFKLIVGLMCGIYYAWFYYNGSFTVISQNILLQMYGVRSVEVYWFSFCQFPRIQEVGGVWCPCKRCTLSDYGCNINITSSPQFHKVNLDGRIFIAVK